MALAYVPPGVSAQELVSPNVSPLLASPANVCIVGLSRGFRVRTDQIRVVDVGGNPAPLALPGLPPGATLVQVTSVKNAINPELGTADGGGYVVTTNYTVQTNNGTITRVDTTGGIEDGDIINVTYQYLPENYFTATRLDNLGTVEDFYGTAWTADGNAVNSPLSYAASLAFENGAATVICQPLFARSTPGDSTTPAIQPANAAAIAAVTSWQDTLEGLRDIEDVNVIVPAIGQSQASVTDAAELSILKAVQDHIQFMRQDDQYIIGIFAEDSSAASNVATQTTLVTHATDLKSRYAGATSQSIVFIEPSRFARLSPVSGNRVVVGGQYVAAAYAGMLAARPVAASLTRKQVSGVSEVLVPRTKQEKNANAQNGLTVIEQRGNTVRVRHAITLDNTNTATRELSIVRAKHRMIESIRDTLDNQVIGEVIADDLAPLVVRSAVIGVLETLRVDGDLYNYRNVEARTLTLDPTTIEVRYSYRPSFPVNYINVAFSIDLTNGVTITGT